MGARSFFGQVLAPLALVSLLAGCVGGDLGDEVPATHLNVLNLIDDAPSVQFILDTTVVATAAYSAGSEFKPAPSGTHSVHLAAVRPAPLTRNPGDTEAIDIGQASDLLFDKDADYTIIGVGTMASPQAIVVDATDQRDNVAETKFLWRIVHAAPGVGAVDVYVTAPEAGIATAQLIGTLAFGADSTPQELTLQRQSGTDDDDALYVNLTVELRAAGTNTVLFNSGPVQFTEQNRSFMAIGTNATGLGKAVQLVAMGTDGAASTYHDVSDPATIRAAHVAFGKPDFNVYRQASPEQTIAQNLSFASPPSGRAEVPNGTATIFGRLVADPSTIPFSSQFAAGRAQHHTVYAIGPVDTVLGVPLTDSRRSVSTQAQLRFLNGAGSLKGAPAVDVYIMLAGETPDYDDESTTARQASALAYGVASSYVAVREGSYDLYFANTGTSTAVLGPVPLQLTHGTSQTLVLTNTAASTLGVVPYDDLAN